MTDEEIGQVIVNAIIDGKLCCVDPATGGVVRWSATACEQIGQMVKNIEGSYFLKAASLDIWLGGLHRQLGCPIDGTRGHDKRACVRQKVQGLIEFREDPWAGRR